MPVPTGLAAVAESGNVRLSWSAPAGAPTGYRVYRDGKLVNRQPVGTTAYVDANAPQGTHLYRVTALFADEESEPSNEVSITNSVASIDMAAHVFVLGRAIVARDLTAPLGVCTPAGTVIYRAEGADHRVDVEPGIYIATSGSKSVRLIVR